MSFSFGFYNSLNHDRRYDATIIGQIFDGMIVDGVYSTIGDKFIVKAAEGMRVNVGSGRAWFNHTWSYNDTDYPIEDEEAEVVLDRIDALVLEVNTNVTNRENAIKFVKGTPSSNPQKPTLANADGLYQYPLAYITIRASVTEILQDDIENTVGTEECPFATALLEHISIDELILQWKAQWNTWTSDQQAAFVSWMNSEETSFATWSVAQRASFATWMTTEQEDFTTWFNNLQDILDENTAAHLQSEIDEINAVGLLGSIINIKTIEPTLYGKRVTITNGTISKSSEFDSDGNAEIRAFEGIGPCTVSSTDNDRTANDILSIPYYGNYDVTLAFWAATLSISTTSESLFGKTITIKKDNLVIGTASFNAQGQASFIVTEPGTYIVSSIADDVEVYEEVVVTTEQTYIVILTLDFNYEEWLEAAGITESYLDLDELLLDEVAIRRLMTIHDAIDHLASYSSRNEDIQKILTNNLCAKWITRRAYAEDTLTNAYGEYMESVGKYGYGKWSLIDNTWGPEGAVPKMTSNTAPYGEASAYQVFDKNATTYASGTDFSYKGIYPLCVKNYKASGASGATVTGTVQGSNNGSTWTNIDLATNNTYYLYHRLHLNSSANVYSLQFYGRQRDTQVSVESADFYDIYGFRHSFETTDPTANITYPSDVKNKDFAKMMTNEGTGTATAGDWEDFRSNVLKNKPCMVTKDGKIDYFLNEDDYSKKENGTASDYNNTSYAGGAFAFIRTLYMKEEYNGELYREVRYATEDLEGYKPIGFVGPDGSGVVRDGAFIPMGYMDGSGNTLVAGTSPSNALDTTQQYNAMTSKFNGSEKPLFFGGPILLVLRDLEYMMFKTTDIKKYGGNGRSNAYTGTSQYNGNIIANAPVANGVVKGFKGTAASAKALNKAFHSQVLFSYQQWLRDPYTLLVSGRLKVSENYIYDLSGGTYTDTGINRSRSSDWQYATKMQKLSSGFPSEPAQENTGSTSLGLCDGQYFNDSGTCVARRLGYCGYDLKDGPAHVYLDAGASLANWLNGAAVLLLSSAGYRAYAR